MKWNNGLIELRMMCDGTEEPKNTFFVFVFIYKLSLNFVLVLAGLFFAIVVAMNLTYHLHYKKGNKT